MKHPLTTALVLTVGLLVGPVASGAESSTPPPAPPAKSAERSAPTKKSSAAPAPTPSPPPASAAQPPPTPSPATTPTGVQGMEREFGERSKDLIEKRKALLERLRLAPTEEEKQRVIAELRRQQQERVEQQRELARQIREQMQNKRSDVRATGPGG